jgi:hypothetical protein
MPAIKRGPTHSEPGGRPYTPCQDTFKPSMGTNNAFPTRYCPDKGYTVSHLVI